MPAPCASTRINGWCRVCSQAAYMRWSHICSLWTFFLCEGSKSSPAQTTRPPSFFPFSTKRLVPYRCVYWVTPLFPFRPTKRLDSQYILFLSLLSSLNHVLDSCSSPPHPSFLFEPRPRFDYRIEKDPHAARGMRFQRKLYLRVIGMWLGVRWEAGSSHTTHGNEEEGVGGPPTQALGERE